MRLFLSKLLLFLLLMVLIDMGAGYAFNKMYDSVSGGEIHKVHSIMTRQTPDLIILGSSRSTHHYVPEIISDSLNIEVYNAGMDGQGIPMAYGFMEGLGQRKYPEYIVCELTPKFDLYKESAPISLNLLYPYVHNSEIEKLVSDFDPTEQLKLKSNLYKYNSTLFRILPALISKRTDRNAGYVPLYGKYISVARTNNQSGGNIYNVDEIKERYLRSFIANALENNSRLIFTISPYYGGHNINYYQKELDIINEYNVPVLNHLNDSNFINEPLYFQDISHMNNDGAELFTLTIVKEIKERFDTSRTNSEL